MELNKSCKSNYVSFKKCKFFVCLLILLFNVIFPLSSFAYNGSSKEKCIKEGAFKNGQCVEIDNHLLYVESFGIPVDTNVPNIVFLPGSGETLETWNKVAPTVAKFAHVVLYNRSGYAPSQQCKKAKTLTAPLVINNLILLLKKIHVPPPYILVGHSHGGLFAQYFALTKPNMIKGIVMVDSSTNQMVLKYIHPQEKIAKRSNDPHYYELMGARPTAEAVKRYSDIKKPYPFENIPMAVLTAENRQDIVARHLGVFSPNMEKDWMIFQNQLAKTSRNSYQIIAYGSGHYIQDFQPDLVVDAIYTMAKANN